MPILVILIIIVIVLALTIKIDNTLKYEEFEEAKNSLREFKKELEERCFDLLLNTNLGKKTRIIYNYEEIYDTESLDLTLEAFDEAFKIAKSQQKEVDYNNLNHYLIKYYTEKILKFGNSKHKEFLSKSIRSLKKAGRL